MDIFCFRQTEQAFQIMQTGRIHERDFAHADDTHFRFVTYDIHDVVELICYAEEERTVDFVHFYAFR